MSTTFVPPTTPSINRPAQDIRTLNAPYINSNNPDQQNQGQMFNTLQEYLDSTNGDLGDTVSLLNSFIAYVTGGNFASSSAVGGYKDNGTGTSLTPDFNTGRTQVIILSGNATINAALNAPAGDSMTIVLVQDATGNRQVTSWDASYLFGGTLGLDPTPSTATVYLFGVNGSGHLFIKSYMTGVSWP